MDAKHASELALWSFLLIFYIASSVSAIAMPRTFFRGIARLEREPSLRRDINSGSSASAEGHSGLLSLLKGNDSANQIMYFGGPLIRNVEVSTIFYGNVSHADRINSFYKFVTSSPYMGLLAQYSTKEYEIGYGSFVESHFETHPRNVTKLDDVKDIQPYLRKLVKNGMLRPNENSYYSIHYPVGLTITDAYGSQSCVDFCGYHNTIDISDISDVDYLYYGVIPSHSSHCIGGCGYASDDFDNLSSVMSHELAEAITNPVIGVATVLGPPIGWYNPQFGGEVSDSCNTIQFTHMDANGANWTMQEVWDNVYSQCIGVVRGYRGIAAVQESEGPPTSYYPPSMTNYGGSLLENVQVNPIYFGAVANQTSLEKFYSFLMSSDYMDTIGFEYGRKPAHVLRGSLGTTISLPANTSVLDDDQHIIPMLKKLVQAKTIRPDGNSFYPIYIAPGVTATRQGSVSCRDFCGYHAAVDMTYMGIKGITYVYYAVISDLTGACAGRCGRSNDTFQNVCAVSSHLLASTITNPAVNIAPRNKQPLAWFDKYNQFEIGSACNTVQDVLRDRLGYNWTVQTVWSNLIKACVSRLPTSVNGSVNFTLTSLSATGTKITGAAPKKLSLTTTAKQNSNTNKKAASSTTAASNLGFPSSNKSTSKSGLKSATKRV